MVDDVVVNKVAIVERCLARIDTEYAGDERNLRENLTRFAATCAANPTRGACH